MQPWTWSLRCTHCRTTATGHGQTPAITTPFVCGQCTDTRAA